MTNMLCAPCPSDVVPERHILLYGLPVAGYSQGEAAKTAGVHRVRGPGDVPKREGAHRPEDSGRLLRARLLRTDSAAAAAAA